MVIKPFKVKPKLPENFEDVAWGKLQRAVQAVANKQPVETSREELYRLVEDLCIHKLSARLYHRLYSHCESTISLKLESLKGQTPAHDVFLEMVERRWCEHCDQMLTIRSIFLYLDRSYMIQNPSVRSIWDSGLDLFCKHMRARAEVETKVTSGLIATIKREMHGERVNHTLLRNLVQMLSALKVYETLFEKPFLVDAELLYTAEGSRYMEHSDVPAFLVHVEKRLQEASDMAVHYLEQATLKPLVRTLERNLLAPHVANLLQKGFDVLMDTNRIPDLHRMFTLFQRVDALDQMKAAFNAYVRRMGLKLVNDEQRDKEIVEELLLFRGKIDTVLAEAFNSDDAFKGTLKSSFEEITNVRGNRLAELIAKFMDTQIKGGKGVSDEEIERALQRGMLLFKSVHAKDIFEAFYKQDLAKRLLFGKCSSFDLEKSMIGKLKSECGSNFTNKLEGMFKDMDLSSDLIKQYQLYARENGVRGVGQDVEMQGQVLTTGYWPAYPPLNVTMPPELLAHKDHFQAFYSEKFQGRRLFWQHRLDHCILRAHFPSGRKELDVSLFQALALMCYNGNDTLTVADIADRTKIEDSELKRTLISLARVKVLVKGRENDTSFVFNEAFSKKLFRIKINAIQIKETPVEKRRTQDSVFRDRQYQIDAAVVRIMKTRKQLSHNLLMSEVFNQLKFPALPADVKQRIESLIERDYMERDESLPNSYSYLA